MDNPLEMIGDALQGDVEIAGKRIPKIALIGGGIGIIILFVLMGKKGGGNSAAGATPFRQNENETETANTEQAIGGAVGGIGEDILATVEGLISDNNSSLADLIASNNSSIESSLAEQIQSVYDSVASSGGNVAPDYSMYSTPLPIDNGGFGLSSVMDYQSYPSVVSNPVSDYNYSSKPSNKNNVLESLKPSAVKDKAGTKAKLGSAVIKPDKSKINQLVGGAKPTNNSIFSFNKKPVNSATTPLGKQGKETKPTNIKPSTVINQKGKQGNVTISKPVASPKTTSAKPFNFTTVFTKVTKPFSKPPTIVKPVQTSKPTNFSQPKQVNYNPIQYQPKSNYQPVKQVSPVKTQPTFGSAYGKIKGFKK